MLRATTACTFSTSDPFKHVDLEMCFAPQRRALFRRVNFQKWSEHGVLCASPQRLATFHLSFGQRAPYPPLWRAYFSTFRNHKPLKKQCELRLSYLFAHLHFLSSHSFSSLIFSLLLFSSLILPTSAFPCVHIVGNLTCKLPSMRSFQSFS